MFHVEHFNLGTPTEINIWVNSNEISGATGGIINQDCNGLPIISSINGAIKWSLAGTGKYCLTFPVASILTGHSPCIPHPN